MVGGGWLGDAENVGCTPMRPNDLAINEGEWLQRSTLDHPALLLHVREQEPHARHLSDGDNVAGEANGHAFIVVTEDLLDLL